MLILAKLIGVIIVVMGIICLLRPNTVKQLISFWAEGNRLYIAGIIRLLFGVILLLAASQCRLVGVIIALGILFILGGVIIFALGLEAVKSMLERWEKASFPTLRILGIIALSIGALLLYAA